MSMHTDEKLPPVRELTHEESRELFDQQAQSWLGISGEEFIRRYDAGEFSDEQLDRDPDIVYLAMKLAVVR